MKVLGTILAVLVVEGLLVLVVMLSGAYDIGTTNHDNALVNWFLDKGAEHSIEHHAKGITPPALSDTGLIALGFHEYDEECVQCHGAPGVKAGEIAEGLWPEAPDLAESAKEMNAAEIYWVIHNGIKFTSMPAWAPSVPDSTLWALNAFIKRLPHLSPAEYQALRARAGESGREAEAGRD